MKRLLIISFVIMLYGCGENTSDTNYIDRAKGYPVRMLQEPINLCEAGDFESSDAANTWGISGAPTKIVDEAGRNNSRGIVFDSIDSDQVRSFYREISPELKFSDLILEGWIKTEDLEGKADFRIFYWRKYESGGFFKQDVYPELGWNYSKPVTGTTTGWVKVSMKVIVPLETTRIDIAGGIFPNKGKEMTGRAYFDDITVKGIAVYDFEKGVPMKRTVKDLFSGEEPNADAPEGR